MLTQVLLPSASGTVTFPKTEDHEPSWRPHSPLEPIQLNTAPLPSEYRASVRQKRHSNPRSRTPSLRSSQMHPLSPSSGHRTPQRTPGAPSASLTPGLIQRGSVTPIRLMSHLKSLQRSNSHGPNSSLYPGNVLPKSAKRWARTAHIHPLRSPGRTSAGGRPGTPKAGGRGAQNGVNDENVFSSGTSSPLSGDAFLSPLASTKRADGEDNHRVRKRSLTSPEGGGVEEGLGGSSSTLPHKGLLNFGGDERDADSNWVDTDSNVDESDVDVFD